MSGRIYLLGNGKSLLDSLPIDGVTMGVNKIGAIYKPDYYVKVDYSPWGGAWEEEVEPFVGRVPCLLWDSFRDGNQSFGIKGMGDVENITWVSRCEHHGANKGHRSGAARWHDPFCTAYNSIAIMAQWAVKLGFEEIVLVGCDLNFTDGKDDHFMPYYDKVDSGYQERNNKNALWAHELIRESCQIPVYNATPNSNLWWPKL